MPAYRAVFLRRHDLTDELEAAYACPLGATTIQGAIEEAINRLQEGFDVTSPARIRSKRSASAGIPRARDERTIANNCSPIGKESRRSHSLKDFP